MNLKLPECYSGNVPKGTIWFMYWQYCCWC